MSYMTPHKHAHMSQSRTIAVSLRVASLSHLPPVATQFKRLSCRRQRLPADISEQRSCPFSTAEPRLQTQYSHPSAPELSLGHIHVSPHHWAVWACAQRRLLAWMRLMSYWPSFWSLPAFHLLLPKSAHPDIRPRRPPPRIVLSFWLEFWQAKNAWAPLL